MSEKLINALEEYEKVFNDGFPTIPLMLNRTEEEVIKMIEQCIKENKDVYTIEFLEDDEDIEY